MCIRDRLILSAGFLAIGAMVQVFGNHSNGSSPQNYYYADGAVETLAYGFAAAAFFLGWIYSGRSRALREFSLPLMLAFLGVVFITVQWVFVLFSYVEEFALRASQLQTIKHFIDTSAVLQLLGWGTVAAALAVSLRVLLARSRRDRPANPSELQWWHLGPTRLADGADAGTPR